MRQLGDENATAAWPGPSARWYCAGWRRPPYIGCGVLQTRYTQRRGGGNAQGEQRSGNAHDSQCLRAAPPKLGEVQPTVLPPLVDPGTADARINLLFREKAFWTFSRLPVSCSIPYRDLSFELVTASRLFNYRISS